jgi:hypothetical protein
VLSFDRPYRFRQAKSVKRIYEKMRENGKIDRSVPDVCKYLTMIETPVRGSRSPRGLPVEEAAAARRPSSRGRWRGATAAAAALLTWEVEEVAAAALLAWKVKESAAVTWLRRRRQCLPGELDGSGGVRSVCG